MAAMEKLQPLTAEEQKKRKKLKEKAKNGTISPEQLVKLEALKARNRANTDSPPAKKDHSNVRSAAIGVAAVGLVAAGAVAGAAVITSTNEKNETRKEKHHQKKVDALSRNLAEETSRRIEAEASAQELRLAMQAVTDEMRCHKATATTFQLEIDALVKQTKQTRPNFDVVFVLDISGSMSGHKSAEMFAALCKVLSMLHPSDGVSILLFNHGIYRAIPLTPNRDINFPNCISSRLRLPCHQGAKIQFICDGQTALWDAVHAGISTVEMSSNHPQLIILTDGGDNMSQKNSQASIVQHLRHCVRQSNGKFHASFITVGDPQASYVTTLASTAALHENFHHYNAASAHEIEPRFQAVMTEMQEIIKISLSVPGALNTTKARVDV